MAARSVRVGAKAMANEPQAHFRWWLRGGVAVVEILTVELNQPRIAQEFGAQLRGLLTSKSADRILLDFHHTKFMTSTSFGELLRFVKDANAEGVRVAVCAMEPAVRMGATILSLDQFIPITADVKTGLAALDAIAPG
jgi:anti-anti-sigma factor